MIKIKNYKKIIQCKICHSNLNLMKDKILIKDENIKCIWCGYINKIY